MKPLLYAPLLLLCVTSILAQQCTHTATDGSKYDVSSLKLTNGQYSFVGSNNYKYRVNVCGNLPTPCYGMSTSSCKTSEFGTEWANGNYYDAKYRDYPLGPSKGVQMIYSGGEPCASGSRSTTINIECDASMLNAVITSVEDDGGCNIIVNMKAKAACPNSPPPVQQCGYTASDGSRYNVSSLTLKNDQYIFSKGNYQYTLNVCGLLPKPCYSMQQSSCKTSEFGIEWGNGVYENAQFKDHPLGSNKGLQMIYNHGGELCAGASRSTTINIACDAATVGAKVTDVLDNNGCNIVVEMKASAACPTKFIHAQKH